MIAPLDLVTSGEAVVAALALALRGNMLQPEAKGWASSRAASLIILGLSITMAGAAIDVRQHGGATPREAVIYAAIAVSSLAMLIRLWRQRRAPHLDQDPKP
jgi:uncharacterized membrane protein YczE